ncbi:hypothetical protein Tco_1111533 [Tanacetum coccineum]|uniref:Uncharacterized protein n=1 Tax=Tanacetum coccineum TaxID=301880 RepID=A0ABQ5INC6_9ASTR
MTKQGNFTQRTPQAKKQSDQASRQISKQASGSANAPYDLVFTAMGPPLGTTQTTATITSTEGLQRATFTTPPQTVPGTNTTEPPPPPLRNKGPELGADNLTLEGVATELAPSDFVSQNYETLVALMQEKTKKRSSRAYRPDVDFGFEDKYHPPRHKRKVRKDNRRPSPISDRIRKKVSVLNANLQNLDTHESNDRRISVRDRLGSRDVHNRLGQRRSPSESPPSSDSEESAQAPQKSNTLDPQNSSDNETQKRDTGNPRNKYREEDEERRYVNSAQGSLQGLRRAAIRTNAYTSRRALKFGQGSPRSFNQRRSRRRGQQKSLPQSTGLGTVQETIPMTRRSIATNSYRGQGSGGGTTIHPTDNDPKEILATKVKLPKTTTNAPPKEQPVGNDTCRLESPVKNIRKGTDKQRSEARKTAPRDKADTIYMGASADILYEHCFQRLRPEVKSQLNPAKTSLTDFTGEKIWPMGQIRLPVMVGNKEHSTPAWMNFMVIRSPFAIQCINGRPRISAIRGPIHDPRC